MMGTKIKTKKMDTSTETKSQRVNVCIHTITMHTHNHNAYTQSQSHELNMPAYLCTSRISHGLRFNLLRKASLSSLALQTSTRKEGKWVLNRQKLTHQMCDDKILQWEETSGVDIKSIPFKCNISMSRNEIMLTRQVSALDAQCAVEQTCIINNNINRHECIHPETIKHK